MSYKFGNDYSILVHEEILKAINKYADEENIPYGLDKHSLHAEELIKKTFQSSGNVFFLSGGTQVNMVGLSYLLKDYEGIISADTGHINVHETGAVEGTGHKIYTVKNKDGKITTTDIETAVKLNDSFHTVKMKAVYITFPTETGTLYTKEELKDIYNTAKANDLYVFIDGARLAVGLTSKYTDVEPSDISKYSDLFYIGGTKNGFLVGEALVINDKKLAEEFRYEIKNKGALLAKGFLNGIEFERAFQDSLYFDISKNTNEMSYYLQDKLNKIGIKCYSPTNQIFIEVNNHLAQKLIEKFSCELWTDLGDKKIIRIVTNFKTTKADVDALLEEFLNND